MSRSSVVQLPNREQAREEASLWIVRMDRGLTDSERRELNEWLAGDPQRLEALAKLAVVWDQADILAKFPELSAEQPQPVARPRFARAGWLAAAAVLAGVAVATAFVTLRTTNDEPLVAAQQPQVYETAVGEQSTVRLPDGSTVTLNTDSSIEVQYAAAQRNIFLRRGEGYFEVAHDAQRPFRVHAGARMMEALGTAFNVNLSSTNDIKLIVTEGKVSVLPRQLPTASSVPPGGREPEAIVGAGNLATIDEGPVLIEGLDGAQIEARLSWQHGMLVFDGEPLEAVLREIGRYTTTELVLDDSLRNVEIGGYFRTGDVGEFLTALRDGLDIDSRRDANGRVILFPAPQSE